MVDANKDLKDERKRERENEPKSEVEMEETKDGGLIFRKLKRESWSWTRDQFEERKIFDPLASDLIKKFRTLRSNITAKINVHLFALFAFSVI